jgi:hypothetical protein
MLRKLLIVCGITALGLGAVVGTDVFVGRASALSVERWTNGQPYGLFFNDYDPNFYTGFVPRVQERDRITTHLARGNQLRVRIVLSDEVVDNYIPDQLAKHALYKEVIDKGIITLTTNTAWEDYEKKITELDLPGLAQKRASMSPEQWRATNIEMMQRLLPDRVYHIQKDFNQMTATFEATLKGGEPPASLEAKLDLINSYFPNRIVAYELTEAQDAAFVELVNLARSGDSAAFTPKAEAFFQNVTKNVYPVRDGKIDYYEITAIYPAGTYDTTTTYQGNQIPEITTTGVWTLIPRMHGKGFTGMVDYISSAGYYGMMPMLPYEYGGGITYNAIHNTGISNWIGGHRLLPTEWKTYTEGSRNGKPFNRVALTSRGPVSHGCTRLNSGHLVEMREFLPSTSEGMKGIINYRNRSQCYDVFDRNGDGNLEVMGVQYYIAFRHTNERVAKQIWAQNNRDDFYKWLYGDEMNYGPIGQVTMKDVCTGKFVDGKAKDGPRHQNLPLYEAPYYPEVVQFYTIKGLKNTSREAMDFNREMRRVGTGYTVDRKILRLE